MSHSPPVADDRRTAWSVTTTPTILSATLDPLKLAGARRWTLLVTTASQALSALRLRYRTRGSGQWSAWESVSTGLPPAGQLPRRLAGRTDFRRNWFLPAGLGAVHRPLGAGGDLFVADRRETLGAARRSGSVKPQWRWFLTGVVPALDDALASIAGETYHLGADHVALARGVLESHRATMEAGLCPPLRVALEVLAWLRANHPELVLATVAS